jgi:biotin carboxyl carrier protein
MAEVTDVGGSGARDGRQGADARAVDRPAATGVRVDPRAVRVRLAPQSRTGDEPAMRVSPIAEPLRMTNPTAGTGPLGGAADVPHAPGETGVLAQGHLVDDVETAASLRRLGRRRHVLDAGGVTTLVIMEDDAAAEGGIRRREVLVDGFRFMVEVESERIAALRERASQGRASSAHSGPLQVKAIIPGKVVAVSVEAGDAVMAGQQLLVVEAMKMQNELRAPRDGTIDRVGVAVGVNIEIGDLLVVIS